MALPVKTVAWVQPVDGGVRVRLRVSPGASKTGVSGLKDRPDGQSLAVSVTAKATDGKANKAVIGWLAKEWSVAKSNVEIVVGSTRRDKVLFVRGTPAGLDGRIKKWVEQLNG